MRLSKDIHIENDGARAGLGRIYMGYYKAKVKRQVVNKRIFLGFPFISFFSERRR